jgi:hypothetical protein
VAEKLSDEEWLENEFFYFLKALDTLTLDAEDQCERMGNYNVAWELQEDVSAPIPAMIDSPFSPRRSPLRSSDLPKR